MATEGGGKIKPKRSHSTSKPYERRKSLLGKVTDTVKDLLAPSWLTDFVSTVSKKTPPKDKKDALIEEEEDVFMSPAQSPSQLNNVKKSPRMQHQDCDRRNAVLAHRSAAATVAAPLDPAVPSTSLAPPQPSFSSSHLPFSKFTQQKSRIPNDDTMSERSDVSRSTSGCSSMIPHPDKQAYQREILQLNDSALDMLKTDFQTAEVFQPQKGGRAAQKDMPAQKPQPIAPKMFDTFVNPPKTWTAEASRQGRPLAPAVREKPGFNSSLFGSPVLNQSSSILGESFGESSFYSGRTTYGGASAYRKLNSTAPYQTALPIRKQLKPKPLNSSFNAVTSSTARRILETLERMSTPLTDAKKIPASESFLTDSVLSFTPGSYRRRTSRPLTGVGATRRSLDVPKGPPTSQLKTPSIASISKNRQKLLSSTPTSSRIPEPKRKNRDQDSGEEDEDSSHEDEPVVIDDRPGGGGGKGGKMMREKSYRSSARRRAGEDEEEEVEPPPPLKTDFTLPVMSMPAFNFKPTPGMSKKGKTVSLPSEDKAASLKFTFSTPIQKSGPSAVTSSERAEGFTFSSPLKVTDKESLPKSSTFTAIGDSQPAFKPLLNSSVTAPVCKLGNGGIGMNMKTAMSSGQAFKPAAGLKKGSVMDVLGGGAFKPSSDLKQGSVMDVLGKDSTKSAGEGSQLKSGSVMDILGKTSNDTSSPSGFKPALNLKQGSVMDILGKKGGETPPSSSPMTKFCKKPGEWDCDTCLVQNKPEATKCVACGTSKPGSGPKPPPPSGTGSLSSGQPSLASMFKSSAGSWDCDTCMIQNKPEDTKCVACKTPKPGAKASGTGSLSSGQPSLSSMFKSSAGSWDCDTCMIQNKSEDTKCVACKTAKPGAKTSGTGSLSSGQPSLSSMFKSSAGSWDCDTCMIQNKPEDTKCVACKTPKPGAKTSGTPETKTNSTIGASGFQISGSMFGSGTASSGGGFGGFGKSGLSTGGFSMGSTDSKNAGLEGGFKIGSGFSFGQPSTKGSDSKSASSDNEAKDGSSSKGDSNSVSNVLSSQKTSSISGGFQFGTLDKKPVQESEGIVNSFKASTQTQVSESKSSGFGFGGSASEASKTSTTSEPSGTDSSNGKLAFGQKTDSTAEKKSDNIFGSGNSLSSATGFSFGQSGATSIASPGGFSFGATAATTTATANTTSTGIMSSGFSFGQDKTDSKAVFGTMPAATTEASKPVAATNNSLFAFGQPVAGGNTDNNKPLGVGGGFPFTANTDTSTAAAAPKRGRDEESGAPAAKKSFSFGQSTNSTSTGGFNFGASASVTSASGVFTFGANSTSSASTAAGTTTSTPSFSFGAAQPAPTASTPFQFSAQTASSGTNSVFQFGNSSAGSQTGFAFGSSAPATTTAPFGTTNTLPQPAFGNTANSTPQTGAQGGGMFSNSTSVFGANNSATPVPAFGAADQNANSGGFSFKMAGANNQSTSTLNSQPSFNFGGAGSGGVFQFTAKGNETSAGAPAQGSTSSGFSFGSTQQPQPAAPAPTFNSTNAMSFTGGNTPSFTIGSTPDTGRKIKRAVRKIRK
ncbi:nuclear pore complex protein Nup153-like isoform X1 [Haliotis cracherodii]|uniref:nuclear pore complex protein Nup153-like isoform X1 n=1 Tax=Haliotis cracherodii TaxID=6455 RepID=UPI0039EBBA10